MKQLISLLFFFFNLFVIEQANGQVPQKFNYQGIARDAKGNPIGNQLLSLKLSILPSADATVPEYEETHTVTTNEFGLYSLQIGNGSSITNEMKNVKWETGNKYIRVAIDPKGGTNYLVAGTSQLLSVPYAIYAERAGSAKETIDAQGGSRTGAVSSNAAHVAADANYLAKFTGLNTIGKSAVYDNGASIGIGSASPLARIHVNGTTGTSTEIRLQHAAATGSSRFAFFADNGTTFSTTGDYTVMNKYTAGTTGTLTTGFPLRSLYAFSNSKGALFFTTAASIGFGQYTASTNTYSTRLFIDSATGNVGLGTVTPASKLEVVGQVKITGGTPGAGKVLTSDASGLATWQTPSGTANGLSGSLNYIPKFTSASTAGNSQLFDNGTNVGIGTALPSAKLDVAGQIKISGGTPGLGKVLTSDANGLATWQTPSGGGSSQWTTSGNNIFSSNTGKVGIGISSPTSKLHVTDTSSSVLTGIIRGEYTGPSTPAEVVGVYGKNTITAGTGTGVQGEGGNIGVNGLSNHVYGYGVYGTGGFLGTGVYGYSNSGIGISGGSFNGYGLDAYSNTGTGLNVYSPKGVGVYTTTDSNSSGVFLAGSASPSAALTTQGILQGTYIGSYAQNAIGVVGISVPASTFGIGVYGYGGNAGVFGTALDTAGYAGYFSGKLYATSASFGTKAFKIDHPLDPANKFLYHSCVESNDMMNIYNGNVVTDVNGDATVELPSYFEALNTDYKYQLTVIGTFAQAIIGEEVNNNQFKIKTNQPNVKVSWQVTGVRNDAMAKAHRIATEVNKVGNEKGKYLNPIENGKTLKDGIMQSIAKPAMNVSRKKNNGQLPNQE